jgi:hypothetical protein
LIFRHKIILTDPAHLDHLHPIAVPIDGGSQCPFADLPKSAHACYFTINPRTGAPVYVEEVSKDPDIELLHLSHK